MRRVDRELPQSNTSHVAPLIDDARCSLVVAAVEDVAHKSSASPALLWTHVFHWAKDLQSPPRVWTQWPSSGGSSGFCFDHHIADALQVPSITHLLSCPQKPLACHMSETSLYF